MEITFTPVLPTNQDVIKLIDKLNNYQVGLYGIEMCNLETPESLQKSNAFMIGAYASNTLAGIGAVKLFDSYAEIKRMFVEEGFRGSSIAENILTALEQYAAKKKIFKICLETGNLHKQALGFYKKQGYSEIESFGDYKPNNVSVYFQKKLNHQQP